MISRQDIDSLFDLSGRVAIVTGGSRGIGRAIAEGFAAAGAKVVVASRKAEACQEVASALEAAGHEALAVPTHMGDLDAVANLAKATADRFGQIDIVVNNAANALALPMGQVTPDAFDKSFAVNVRGPLFLVQHALPHLEKSEHASVINVISAGVFTSAQFVGLYAAGKSALRTLTRSMAHEFAPRNIRVNAIAPGTVDTDMVRNNDPAVQAAMRDAAPVKRMASPNELVGMALYLASDAGSFATGQTFIVDGGMTTS